MAIITLTTDFGLADHYVAAVKAKILSLNPNITIVDISHDIDHYNLAHASYVLRSVFRDFPKGTVHLVAVNSSEVPTGPFIAAQLEGHYFVVADNGLIGLLSNNEADMVVDVNSISTIASNFGAADILAPAAAKLASGTSISELGNRQETYKLLLPRQVRATKSQISGNVIRVDHYGNLVTNIEKSVFDLLSEGKKFEVNFGREKATVIHNGYNQVENGECFLIFNAGGFLEIGLNKGNAAQLLGLTYDSTVVINFQTDI